MAGRGDVLALYLRRSQSGLSLVELLISIVLGLVLSSGMVAAYWKANDTTFMTSRQRGCRKMVAMP